MFGPAFNYVDAFLTSLNANYKTLNYSINYVLFEINSFEPKRIDNSIFFARETQRWNTATKSLRGRILEDDETHDNSRITTLPVIRILKKPSIASTPIRKSNI